MVEPVHPFECRKLDGLEVPPRTTTTDHFGLVQPDHRLGEGVVVRVADAPDRRINAGVCQAVGVTDREILRAPVAVMEGERNVVGN